MPQPTIPYNTIPYPTLLHSILLYSTLLYSTLLYPTLPYSTPFYSTLLYSTLLYSTLLYSTLLYSTLLFSTLLYSTLLCSTLLYSTLFHSTLLYSTLLYSTLLYSTLLYSFLLYTLFYSLSLKMADVQEYHAVIPVANLQMKEVDEPDFIPPEAFKSTLSFEYSRKQLSWKMLSHRENVSLTITWNTSDGTIAAANHLDRNHRLLEDEGIMNTFKRSWLRRRQKPSITVCQRE